MIEYTATYSPEDNKLRLYATQRLDSETYNRLKALGFKYAPKQELFVAPMWTPQREDILLELAGEIENEDISVEERAKERAERFAEYSEKRLEESEQANKRAMEIAYQRNGQPRLADHYSHKAWDADQKRIENASNKSLNCWKLSTYWVERAKGVLSNTTYRELPAVRARRIRSLESDLRKEQKTIKECETRLNHWTNDLNHLKKKDDTETTFLERALFYSNHFDHGYVSLPDGEKDYGAWSYLRDGKITPEEVKRQRLATLPNSIAYHSRWVEHLENRLTYERTMLGEQGGLPTDQKKLEKGGAIKYFGQWSEITKVNKVTVSILYDYHGNGGKLFLEKVPFDKVKVILSKEEWETIKAQVAA